MVQFQSENNEVTCVWINCTHCNKQLPCPLSKTVTICTPPVYQSRCVSSCWSIVGDRNKGSMWFSVYGNSPYRCTSGPWYNATICKNYNKLYLRIHLLLYTKTDMNWFASYTYITNLMISQLIQQDLVVEELSHKILQYINP